VKSIQRFSDLDLKPEENDINQASLFEPISVAIQY
jgi:hypothetical protein